jgi:hypothetical protein
MNNGSPLYVTTLIAGAFFTENLDEIIIATAFPQLATASAISLKIDMAVYPITLAVFISISGNRPSAYTEV